MKLGGEGGGGEEEEGRGKGYEEGGCQGVV